MQGAVQLCLRASREQNAAADTFLQSGCAVLRRAFGFEGLLLQPVTPGAAPCGATIVWWGLVPLYCTMSCHQTVATPARQQ